MRFKHIISSIVASLCFFSAHAQFIEIGNEPAKVRWSQISTDNYKIIYPRGLDSLARAYATSLEQSALTIGGTVGYTPNQMFKKPMPVILHPHTAYSNGQVSWTPRRVDLYTVPDAYTPDASPWEKHLVLHESRHVAQMQYNTDGIFKAGKVLTGQLLAVALAAIYCGQEFFEGDAVVAETAMTKSGRGRSADFLEYYRTHISGPNTRDYHQWRYQSQKTYIPDYYRLGYLNFAGIRSLYDAPDFTARYFGNLKDAHGVSFFNFSKTTKQLSGKGRVGTFKEISDSLRNFWLADEQRRAPFTQAQQFTPHSRKHSEFNDLISAGGDLYAVRTSIVDVPKIVKLDADGNAESISLIAGMHSPLKYSPVTGELFWSEVKPSARWELQSFSVIKAMTTEGKVRTLAQGKRYYNPDPHPEEAKLAVVSYPEEGGSRIRVISTEDASSYAVYVSPAEMQYLAPLWVGDELYTSAITDEGIGIYRVKDGNPVLQPTTANLERLFTDGERIWFSCDVSGVKELYSMVKNCIYLWNGSVEVGFVNLNTNHEDYVISTFLEVKPNLIGYDTAHCEDIFDRFTPYINISFAEKNDPSKVATVSVDYDLYKMLKKVSVGYRPTVRDNNHFAGFVAFVNKLSGFSKANEDVQIKHFKKDVQKKYSLKCDEFGTYEFKEM